MTITSPEAPDFEEHLAAVEGAEILYNARTRDCPWVALSFEERLKWIEDAKALLLFSFGVGFDVGYEHGYDVGVAVDV